MLCYVETFQLWNSTMINMVLTNKANMTYCAEWLVQHSCWLKVTADWKPSRLQFLFSVFFLESIHSLYMKQQLTAGNGSANCRTDT